MSELGIKHSTGGRTYPMPAGMIGDAEFDGDKYRLWLSRNWHPTNSKCGYALFVGMNPSSAEIDLNDHTISKDIGFARCHGHHSLVKVNVSAFRLTASDNLESHKEKLFHLRNLTVIRDHAAEAKTIFIVTGRVPKCLRQMAIDVFEQLHRDGRKMFCLGTTQGDGWPYHTRRPAYSTSVVGFNWPPLLSRPDNGALSK